MESLGKHFSNFKKKSLCFFPHLERVTARLRPGHGVGGEGGAGGRGQSRDGLEGPVWGGLGGFLGLDSLERTI